MAVEEEVDFLLHREIGKGFPVTGWIGHKRLAVPDPDGIAVGVGGVLAEKDF
jgi:hypothetical protein